MYSAEVIPPDVYAHLRELAGRIHRERGGAPTFQPTIMLHEAWLKLASHGGRWESRSHFLAVAARAMRQVLMDYARERGAQRRGGDWERVTLTRLGSGGDEVMDLLELDSALTALAALSPRGAEVVQLRYFGGLTRVEIAEVLQVSPRTVDSEWRFARAWLSEHLS